LLPVDPIEKSEKRLLIFRFTRASNSWFDQIKIIETGNKKEVNAA
jgi:RNA polymerase-associated protein